MVTPEILYRFKGVKKQGDGYMCLCSAHNDHNPSLSIGLSDDGNWILLHCFAGCTTEAILSAAGLKKTDLYIGPKDEKPAKLREIVYRYCDTDGTLRYTKTRVDYADGTKKCYFLQPNGTRGVKGVKRVLYNLPAVCEAEVVYFVEGEKCVHAVDRSLLFELERVPETERKELSEVYRAFEEDRASILGGIFDTLSAAMALFPTVKLDRLPRMADFARWGYAIAEALGGHGEQFRREYAANYERQNTEAIESDPVATLTIDFMRGRKQWSGRVSALFVQLVELAQEHGINKSSKSLPPQPNALSRRLKGLKSNLEAVGITFTKDTKSDAAYITLYNENISTLPSYQVDATKIMGRHHGDAAGGISPPAVSSPPESALNHAGNGDAGGNCDDSEDSENDEVDF